MNKREFLKKTAIISAGVAVYPLISCTTKAGVIVPAASAAVSMKITLPALGYAYSALEPAIDAQTMEIHHTKHHQAYITKLNEALEANPEFGSLNDARRFCSALTTDHTALRNHGGGHINHSLFWNILTPGGSKVPGTALAEKIKADFGSHEEFVKQFSDAAKSRFGSGWAWLNMGKEGKLFVSSTANQDNPLMSQLIDKPGEPILGIDVWEHAYYLNYQNRRPDYVTAFMGIVNWDVVESNWKRATARGVWNL
jgi:Fe-Mn family superoxide dismutase